MKISPLKSAATHTKPVKTGTQENERHPASKDAAQEIEDIIGEVTQDSKSASRLKFLLFMEDFPAHRVKHDLGVSDCLLAFLLTVFLGPLGFLVWCNFTIIGFLFYYAAICLTLLETLHLVFDRK